MNAGTPPERGKSRMTISTYRITRDGRRTARTVERAYGDGDPTRLRDSQTWPPCRCARCRDHTPG